MTELNIETYQAMVDDWIRTFGVRYFSELTNLAQLVEEVGEVARIMARVFGDQSFKSGGGAPPLAAIETHREALADELADVIFVLACIANQTGIHLPDALRRNLDKKTRRDASRHRNNPKLQA